MKIFLTFGILIISFRGMAQDYAPKNFSSSPFNWLVIIDHKQFNGTQINELLKNRVSINNGKNSCKFEFNTEWDTKSHFAKELGEIYSERLWLECMVGDVKISPNAISCRKYKNSDPEFKSLSIDIGSSNISIDCSSFKKN
jgi:hypothetical protein